MSPALPMLLAALLVGAGLYGVLARRHAVLMLIGVELLLAAAGLMLVTADSLLGAETGSGPVITIFIITIAAAEVVVALAVFTALYRLRGHVDLDVRAEVADPDGSELDEVDGEVPAR
ncbi:NADH-quinone oxidoreductase subunit NuoK [Ornithinimicrobium sp. INDO-MA30-4]|uniref:NADH-quinone oxidoreductase subunit NuoK n=1 Tax=Ornithinimicrobium sp. INDO-MA30-4 TaxID=2908651 RepID=UPI001F3BDF1D|nr:NADH-quinone oxidoreductase subunit NuoK [Ornithinimicrobium sp. INDO-MA30-4]UJH69482.1 NADH-quinone oxidoreductase subunit NuoK [Ornithinimicrobium sp. INDO-MA30-4]